MPTTYTPQNALEAALAAAATDEAARPVFYKVLLESQVFIIPAGTPPEIIDGVTQEDTTLSLAQLEIAGAPHVPFFTSESRLPEGTRYLGMAATTLFQLTSSSNLILNPGSEFSKVFLPHEVASLLDGSIFRPGETVTARAGQQQIIGQPRNYPHDFAAALTRFFAGQPNVERAYLAQHFIPGIHPEPALLVAVVAPEAGFEHLAGAIGIISKETNKSHSITDVTRMQRDRLGYFEKVKPVYQRKRQSLFARFFG